MTILAVIGSQLLGRDKFHDASELMFNYFDKNNKAENVISGGAVGIDSLAITIARLMGFETEEYLPTRRELLRVGFARYKPRNIRIAQDCDKMLCIRTSESETFGSGWTMEYAKRIGKEVEHYLL